MLFLFRFVRQIIFAFVLLAFSWLIFFLNSFLPVDLNRLGIEPREVGGLMGIFIMPFLHGNIWHISNNSVAFIALSGLLILFHGRSYGILLLEITLITGLLVWLFSLETVIHIGASGVIFGMSGFLLFAGFFNLKIVQVIAGIITLFFYGLPLLIGLVPIQEGISYSGHWFGFITGVVLAFIHKE